MKVYKNKEEEWELEDKDFLLISAIDNLALQIKLMRLSK